MTAANRTVRPAESLQAVVRLARDLLDGQAALLTTSAGAAERALAWTGPLPLPATEWPVGEAFRRRIEPGAPLLIAEPTEEVVGLPPELASAAAPAVCIGLPGETPDAPPSARLWVLGLTPEGLDSVAFRRLDLLSQIAGEALLAVRRLESALTSVADKTRILETITDAHIAVDSTWRIVDLGPGFEMLAGRSRSLLMGRNLWDEFPASNGTDFAALCREAAGRRSPSLFEAFSPLFGRWVEVFAIPVDDRLYLYFRDIEERKRAELELVATAYQDAMTGLANRSQFMEWLRRALSRSRRRPSFIFAVLFLDVDRLKVINDTLGHLAGDEVLRTIAHRLEEAIRPGDNVARLGGDEFAILLYNLRGINDATRIASRIQQKLRIPFEVDGQEILATASVGIALSSTGYDRAEDMLHHADLALYRAKIQGRERFEVFDETMRANAAAVLRTRRELQHGIDAGELDLWYQPIISLYTGRVEGVGSTLTWRHPTRGRLSAPQFLPVAANSSQMLELGRWTIASACRTIRDQQEHDLDSGPLGLGVRLSSRHFLTPDFGEEVARLIREGEADASRLRLEIPIGVLSDNPEAAAVALADLAALDLVLSIYGFGNGPVPASQIGFLPFRAVHIDFQDLARADRLQEGRLIQALIAMARHLGLEVIAENVPELEDLPRIHEMGCTYVNGHVYTHPVDAKAAAELLRTAPVYPIGPDPGRGTVDVGG